MIERRKMFQFLPFKRKVLLLCGIVACAVITNLSYGSEECDRQRPHEHICSISMNIMQDPVVAADGFSYDRTAIQQWFIRSGKSPKTGLLLDNKNLIPNQTLKTMIREWIPGRQLLDSPLEGKSSFDIAGRIKTEFRNNAGLLHASKDKHIVAFLGNTGAGKSTLVNLLAGKELVIGDDGQDYVLANPDDVSAMKIGIEGDSQTFYPKSIQVGDLLYFDLPGFNDSDGSERNLVNAAFIRQILLEAASVRLVFVVGQDEFTALRSNYVKKLFDSIQRLFVADTQSVDLINNSIFIATKITCKDSANTLSFLLAKTSSVNKSVLHYQLQSWIQTKRLFHMYAPNLQRDNSLLKNRIIDIIHQTQATKVLGINVSALYPTKTKGPIIRMFSDIMMDMFNKRFYRSIETLSNYDSSINSFKANDFWQQFDQNLCEQDKSVGLLKEFCIDSYKDALRTFEQENEITRQLYIEQLVRQRQEKVSDIEKRTEQRAREVIENFVPQERIEGLMLFDFGYHKDLYDQVCGVKFINRIAVEPVEQEVVRQYYAGFISRHNHDQMLAWHQRFINPQIQSLRDQVEALTIRLDHQVRKIERPLRAKGHESILHCFINGKLIYKPDPNSDAGKIEMPFSDLSNSLEGTFDLSRCGEAGRFISIATGFRKEKVAANKERLEIWIVPKFIIEQNINGPARHLQEIKDWPGQVGILWTHGDWDNMDWYDYLVKKQCDEISSENLYENWCASACSQQVRDAVRECWDHAARGVQDMHARHAVGLSRFMFDFN